MKIVHVGGGLHNSIPREGLPQDLEISISKSKNTNLLPIVCNNANDLYDVFVKKNSLFELNISFHTRCTVEELFSEGKLTLSSLEPIYREVMNNMFANTYPRFLAETLDT
ncbi:hypothetical protein HMI54_005851 [Coelomomyces lativittatus]|nr:hypothetical protein HMI55_003310 [Coelomomyces lativittatus]KAJ1505569.1 hypothetical protein HMI54_005851 [Coelomomyces lativittatus]